jgi:hypothetical protein
MSIKTSPNEEKPKTDDFIVRVTPNISLPYPSFPLLKTITTVFIILLHISILSTSAILTLLYSLHSPSSLPTSPQRTVFIILAFIFKSIFIVKRGFTVFSAVDILHFGQISLLYYSPLPFPLDPVLFNSFHCVLLCHLPL